jgi:hypothetical protein
MVVTAALLTDTAVSCTLKSYKITFKLQQWCLRCLRLFFAVRPNQLAHAENVFTADSYVSGSLLVHRVVFNRCLTAHNLK